MTKYPPGWDCERIGGRMERYLTLDLPRPELLAVAAHLDVCELCFERVMAYRIAVVVASVPIEPTPKTNGRPARRNAAKRKGRGRRG